MSSADIGLPEALEHAATAMPQDADAIRPANGDPIQLAQALDPAGAARVLGWLLANEPSAGEELAGVWAADPQGAGQTLFSLDPGALPKAARKSLRRVLHRLRSQGVSVPVAERQTVVATLPPLNDGLCEARVSPLDPRGARVVYLALDHPSGGVRLFEVVIDDVQGILEFEVYNSGRRRVRNFLRDSERVGTNRAAAAPPDAVRALISRAAAAHPESRSLPRGFSEWRGQLTEVAENTETPGEIVRATLGGSDAGDAESISRVLSWVKAGSLGPWPPDAAQARVVAERIAEAGRGVLVVSGEARREQVNAALDAVLEEIYTGDFAECTAQRFEETAYVMSESGRSEDARAALATAAAFRAGRPTENPVARELLEVLLAPVLKTARGEGTEAEQESTSLLVKP